MKERSLNYYNYESKRDNWPSWGNIGALKVGDEVVLLCKFSKKSFINTILYFYTLDYDFISPKNHLESSTGHPRSSGVNSKNRKFSHFRSFLAF